jgi:adenylate kinase
MLDGFPRTKAQAETLTKMLHRGGLRIDRVVCVQVDKEELIRRLSGRRTCRNCMAPYHVTFNPPEREGVCDKCGGELYQRDDDREDAIRARLETYEEQTKPLIEYYQQRGLLEPIEGTGSMEEVYARIRRVLG